MQLVAPDILADACGLSPGLASAGVAIGLVLWLLGWWSHRFWIVLTTTLLAGLIGLHHGPNLRTPALVAAPLLALAAGVLALALIRVFAFAACGLAGLLAVHALAPNLGQPLVCFVVAGLLGLLLFRVCIMALSSLVGAVLLSYSGLCLLNRYGALDAVAWTEQGAVLLNWICLLIALLGFIFQFLFTRRLKRKEKADPKEEKSWDVLLGKPAWTWGNSQRKAG